MHAAMMIAFPSMLVHTVMSAVSSGSSCQYPEKLGVQLDLHVKSRLARAGSRVDL